MTIKSPGIGTVGPGGITGLANPSASVGLTAVNGSAATAMRSDGAPALSQAIVPTWTGKHLFTDVWAANAGSVALRSTGPVLELANTSGAADAKNWFLYPTPSGLNLDLRSDDYSTSRLALTFARTGNALTSLSFGNATDNAAYLFLGTGTIRFNSSTTGGQTATFSATNKPGVGTAGPISWISVLTSGGTQGYVPIFGA